MRYKILSVFAALAVMTACSDLTSINQNPNGPVDVPPTSLLPSVIQTLVGGVDGVTSLNIRGGGLWAQYYAEIQYRDEDKYIVRSGTSGGWGFYNSALEDIQRMIVKGKASNTANWTAVGKILKAYVYSVMTDAMGALPYNEALKGDTILHPTYDTQQVIYDSLFALLTQADAEIDLTAGAVGFDKGDLMYGGKMIYWKQFANSLRLRLAIHLSQVDPVKGGTEAAAALANGVFTTDSASAKFVYLTASPNRNPIYDDARSRDDYGMSKTFVDSLTSWADPRLPVFSQLNTDTIVANRTYRGLPNGLNDGAGPALIYISRFGARWRSTAGARMDLLSYSEVLFLKAEAEERGWVAGGSAAAATDYANAITASMTMYGVSGGTAAYLGQAKVGYDAAGATLPGHLQQIAYQKWTSLFMQGMEAWTEVRRTRVPLLTPGPNAVFGAGTPGRIPERLPYDDQENVLNASNVAAAVSAQGFSSSNDIQKPLWFTGRQ